MNCDICGEKIRMVGNKFTLAVMVYDIADFRAHLECARVFNAMKVCQRITYLENWLKCRSMELMDDGLVGMEASACYAVVDSVT